jgi:uncharacterized protein YndB with AHSA1/START domain
MTMALMGNAATTIDRRANAISMRRSFAAPRERVFEAWTVAEHIACWWDPTNVKLAECEVDLRPGGRFRFVNQGSHGAPEFGGVYREISPPVRLVFEAMGSVGTVALEDLGDRTLMTVTIQCASPEHLEQFIRMGVDVGTARTLDNLVAHVARMRP